MDGLVDAVLLGVVDRLGTVRGPFRGAHLAWPHHPRIRVRRVADTARFHPGVAVDLRQYRHRPGAQPWPGGAGRGGPARCGDDAVQAAGIPACRALRGRCRGGDRLRAVPDPGRFGHADDRQPVYASR
ncbi:hypothetical protein G6F68_016805 [Rhizopus microsporus]|nr:hypothetical protein G6F68_016805 [Rhizopus microsporus]